MWSIFEAVLGKVVEQEQEVHIFSRSGKVLANIWIKRHMLITTDLNIQQTMPMVIMLLQTVMYLVAVQQLKHDN